MLRWLDEGGDPNARNEIYDGSSCGLLEVAAYEGNATLVRELLARGADPRSADVTGWSVMHAAASSTSQANAAVVALVADAGGNVNARMSRRVEYDSDGDSYVVGAGNPSTPLMCAAERSVSVEVVRVLLSRGADFAATDHEDATVEDYARRGSSRPSVDAIGPLTGSYPRIKGEDVRILNVLAGVRAAGSWKRYVSAWRVQFLLLQRLCSTGRAFPMPLVGQDRSRGTPSIEVLEATSGCKVTRTRKRAPPTDATEEGPTDALMARLVVLPPPMVGKVAGYWRTARDPLY